MKTSDFWIITLCIAGGTYLLRAFFLFVLGKAELSERVKTMFKYIPVSLFAALIAPPIFLYQGKVDWLQGKERVLAAAAAALIAWKGKSMIPTLLGGMGVLYLLVWLG